MWLEFYVKNEHDEQQHFIDKAAQGVIPYFWYASYDILTFKNFNAMNISLKGSVNSLFLGWLHKTVRGSNRDTCGISITLPADHLIFVLVKLVVSSGEKKVNKWNSFDGKLLFSEWNKNIAWN